ASSDVLGVAPVLAVALVDGAPGTVSEDAAAEAVAPSAASVDDALEVSAARAAGGADGGVAGVLVPLVEPPAGVALLPDVSASAAGLLTGSEVAAHGEVPARFGVFEPPYVLGAGASHSASRLSRYFLTATTAPPIAATMAKPPSTLRA